MQGIFILVILLGGAFAGGYFTRDFISRRRRAEALRWRDHRQSEWFQAAAPANTNEAVSPSTGELGQMLTRWETRARARRTG
ncbi:hypothetical protein [Bradyrhizobium sp.]|uniref:hypothetical protein n=1 Tax=Bradyrhizobium sp. TaxID=376 RepID=UPI0039E3744B